jgi:uncharacterized protein (TIGR02596 family)
MVHQLKHRNAFTLIELLVVVAIIGTLAVAIVPGIRGVSESYSLTSAADQVASAMNLARQTAIARNRPVEVRLYEMPATAVSGSPSYRLLAALIPDPSNPANDEWVAKLTPLPNGIIFDDGTQNNEFSTLIAEATTATDAVPRKVSGASSGVPAMVRNRNYISFTIRSDGSTDLDPASTDPWTLSLRVERDQSGDSSRPSNNFVTLLLDPVLGRLKVFRP